MTEKDIKLKIIEKVDVIAREMSRGKDIMLTKSANDVTVKKITVQKA